MKKIFFLFVIIYNLQLHAQTWLPMDKGIDCSIGGTTVRNIVVDSIADKLYVSGIFVEDGNCSIMRGIAQWNGQSWDSIGRGSEGSVPKFGMTMYKDTLYASGNFYNGNTTIYTAKWNGTFWDTILNSSEIALTYTEKDRILYIGGTFDYWGGDSTYMIKKYDGTHFTGEIPYCFSGGGNSINAMAFYRDTLYVAGYYDLLSCYGLGSLGKWDGTAFLLVSPEFANDGGNCNIQAMVEFQGELYVGGYFLQSHGYAGNFIMKWNGTSFSSVGTGMNNRVRCMKVYNNKLYVGGDFTSAGGLASNCVAMWDGSNWHSMTTDTFDVVTGASPSVEAMAVYHDTLIIGGYFKSINGDTTCRRVAKYNAALTGIAERNKNSLMSLFPNPASDLITIELPEAAIQTTNLQIKNALGQTIKTTQLTKGNKQLEIDISDLAKGFYFVQLQSGNRLISKKFIKQ